MVVKAWWCWVDVGVGGLKRMVMKVAMVKMYGYAIVDHS
jgi:hypothetical protein